MVFQYAVIPRPGHYKEFASINSRHRTYEGARTEAFRRRDVDERTGVVTQRFCIAYRSTGFHKHERFGVENWPTTRDIEFPRS